MYLFAVFQKLLGVKFEIIKQHCNGFVFISRLFLAAHVIRERRCERKISHTNGQAFKAKNLKSVHHLTYYYQE